MIYYLGYYSCEQIAAEKRLAAPPAMNKMGYIISVLAEVMDCQSMVVSPCETTLHGFVKGSICDLGDRVSLKTFDSFCGKNKSLGSTQLFTVSSISFNQKTLVISCKAGAEMQKLMCFERWL